MGERIGSSPAAIVVAGRIVVGIVLAVVAALGVVQPGASAEPDRPAYENCPPIPVNGSGDAQMLPQDPCWPPDPCSVDSDGDGLLDCEDPCPDEYANTCDDPPPTTEPPATPPPTSTPPTTAPPTLAPSPTASPTTPQPTAVPGCQVACAYERTVGLRLKGPKLRGSVDSAATGCRAASVTLWRVKKGADQRLVVITTRTSGAFSTRRPAHAGRYYVTVASPDTPLCGTARSRSVKVARR